MTDEPSTRDVVAALAYLAGVILILCAFGPFRVYLLLIGCLALIAGFLIALRKFAAMGGALFVMAARFLWVFLVGKDPRMLIFGLIAAAGIYLIFRLDPASSAP